MIAVTGATGYIGREVLRVAARYGVPVAALARRPVAGAAAWTSYSLAANAPALAADTRAVIHLAYDAAGALSFEQERRALTGLLERATQVRARFVFVSTQGAARPVSEYARRKAAFEAQVIEAGGVVVRPGLVYGGRTPSGLYGTLSRLAVSSAILPRFMPPVTTQLCHVSTLADLLVRLTITDPAPRAELIEYAGPPITFHSFLRLIARDRSGPKLDLPTPLTPLRWLSAHLPGRAAERLNQLFTSPPMAVHAEAARLPPALGVARAHDPERRARLREASATLRAVSGRPAASGDVRAVARLTAKSGELPLLLGPGRWRALDYARHRRGASAAVARRLATAAAIYEGGPTGRARLKKGLRPMRLALSVAEEIPAMAIGFLVPLRLLQPRPDV